MPPNNVEVDDKMRRYTLRGEEKINHLLFMDDLKLYRKSEN